MEIILKSYRLDSVIEDKKGVDALSPLPSVVAFSCALGITKHNYRIISSVHKSTIIVFHSGLYRDLIFPSQKLQFCHL